MTDPADSDMAAGLHYAFAVDDASLLDGANYPNYGTAMARLAVAVAASQWRLARRGSA